MIPNYKNLEIYKPYISQNIEALISHNIEEKIRIQKKIAEIKILYKRSKFFIVNIEEKGCLYCGDLSGYISKVYFSFFPLKCLHETYVDHRYWGPDKSYQCKLCYGVTDGHHEREHNPNNRNFMYFSDFPNIGSHYYDPRMFAREVILNLRRNKKNIKNVTMILHNRVLPNELTRMLKSFLY